MLNKVTLIGNLGADPEIKHTQDGRPIANMSLATSESWRDKSTGERKTKTEWHRVVCFNEGLCKVIEQYLKKGSKIFIEGKIKTRKWQDKDGKDRYSTEVVMENFDGKLLMLDGRNGGDSTDESGDEFGRGSSGGGAAPRRARPGRNDDMNDDIPFGPEFR